MVCEKMQACAEAAESTGAYLITEPQGIVEYTDNHVEPDADGRPLGDVKGTCKKTPSRFCSCVCFSIAAYAVLLAVISNLAMDGMIHLEHSWGSPVVDDLGRPLTPDNVSSYTWWPGCDDFPSPKEAMTFSACGAGCFGSALPNFVEAQLSRGWQHVSYPSRADAAGQHEVVDLTAWYLDAGPGSPAVVVQHGMTASFTSVRVLVPAAMLRAAGFSVLVPNLRDHGTSGRSSYGKFAWGWDYPYDVLGAWDFLVSDPQGVLGGARAAETVGFWGMSMGGFSTANAFGLEPRAAAAWLDGAVFDPRSVFGLALPPLVSELFTRMAWWSLESRTGLALRHHVPEKELPRGPHSKRPIFLAHSPGDEIVGVKEGMHYEQLIRTMPEQYSLHVWFQDGTCNGESHCAMALAHSAEYAAKLCEFFSRSLLGSACSVDFSNLAGSSLGLNGEAGAGGARRKVL